MYTKDLYNPRKKYKRNKIYQKIVVTLVSLLLFRIGNLLPLPGLDPKALEQAFIDINQNAYLGKLISMYSSGGSKSITALSLGIIPYINASIFVDLLATAIKGLENLQEEGESGKKVLNRYKKILAFFISIVQGLFLLLYLKDYFYNFTSLSLLYSLSLLTCGSMITIYLTNKIDDKGIGNGSSVIVFCNIILSFLNSLNTKTFFINWNFFELILVGFFLLAVIILQKIRITIPLISARQLSLLQESQKGISKGLQTKASALFKENGLSIKLNQAGIFPIIIASNLMPFFSFINSPFLLGIIYNFFIIAFNYFYTLLFWDPEKISKQLSKSSVSIVNVKPGKETVQYLYNIVKSTSLSGGLALASLVTFYNLATKYFNFSLLNTLSISSLIIITGVCFEIQTSLYSLYQSLQNESIEKI